MAAMPSPSPDESNALIGRGFDAELLGVELQTLNQTGFHVGDMRVDLGFFCNDGITFTRTA